MKTTDDTRLRGIIEDLLASRKLADEATPTPYWYPLSLPTYGVDEILESIDSLCNVRTTMGEKTLEFERRFTEFQGCAESVMVNSGSSADLLLSFLLTNPMRPLLEKGQEILMPVVTWPTHVWSAMMAGLKVRFVDVDPDTLNVNVEDLESKVNPATGAIFLVHLMGNPCPMDRILPIARSHDLLLLEDCCEGLGAQWDGVNVGNFGIGRTFSFFFSHHITTMEGGMIVCPDGETADHLRILRSHGWLRNVHPKSSFPALSDEVDPRYAFVNWGFNVRPTEVHAAFGLCQISKVVELNRRRDELASRFFSFIDQTPFLSPPRVEPLAKPAWFGLPLIVNSKAPFDRLALTSYLEAEGIETRPIVTGNILRQPASRLFEEFRQGAFPGGDAVHDRGLYLGLSPMASDASMDRLIGCLGKFLARF